MSSDVHFGDTGEPDPLADVPTERYDVLRHPRSVRILSLLSDADDYTHTLSELTTALVEQTGADASTGQRRDEIRIDLVHHHLPRLDAHGLIDWSPADAAADATSDDGTATLIEEPPISPDILSLLLETGSGAEETLLDRLVHPVRLELLEYIENADKTMSVDELATALATTLSVGPTDAYKATIELHHNHLPALAEIDAIDYDREAQQVSASSPPAR
ncbi:hypothetical protein C482_00510 [Natrialba chahannaoensis JCM 10990]|uniref:DUF7344 domain-containing protein n=1 Tax=Natrialba chahannaoensis JCM 10990 TaxID=1227492 RepID=M0B7K5_9EURY|nr:hypothetical protein [Natrialba chahannaoensis]ELZ06258.1 hypothetical protein C482_00510 [Natrialba chahannaoensis JCM 10990]